MIQGILEQIKAFVAGLAAGALAPFAWVFDFAVQLLPMWALVAGLVLACVAIGMLIGGPVRTVLGWVGTAALAVAGGATWQWLKDRQRNQAAKPKAKPVSRKPPSDGSGWGWPR